MECKYYSKCCYRDSCSKAPLDDIEFENVDWKRTPACFAERRSRQFKRRSINKVPKFRDYYE